MHSSQSGMFTPCDVAFARDAVAAACAPNLDTLVVRDVEVEELQRHHIRGTVQTWNDRRTDLYRVTFRMGDRETHV